LTLSDLVHQAVLIHGHQGALEVGGSAKYIKIVTTGLNEYRLLTTLEVGGTAK
jgi:hypothetical protein